MLHSVDMSDYMLYNPAKVLADDDLFQAIDIIIEKKISGVCVVDDNDRLVGILSEMDCLQAILAAAYNKSGNVGKVRDFMTSNVTFCGPHDDVVDVAKDMLQKGHRRRPVVSEGKLIGQITCRQLLRVVSQFNNPDTVSRKRFG